MKPKSSVVNQPDKPDIETADIEIAYIEIIYSGNVLDDGNVGTNEQVLQVFGTRGRFHQQFEVVP